MTQASQITQLLGQIADLKQRERTLRDDFAMAALTGLLASEQPGDAVPLNSTARDCFRYADAMMAARTTTTN